MQFILQLLIRLMQRTQFFVCRTVKLCEKPFAVNAEQVQQMITTAKMKMFIDGRHVVKVSSGYEKIEGLGKQGKIGKLDCACRFGFLPKEKS